MANPPPPYEDLTGISRTVMKDNAQESITNYNGNARPGEIVVNLLNNDVYIGNTNGNLNLLVIGGGSGNSEPAGPVGAIQYNSGGNLFGASANLTFVNNTLTAGNVIPAEDNVYFLGNATNRWANIWLGPGTLYITDSNVAANTTAELTVLNGVLQINGADQLQVGQLKFIDNTIESITGNIDIEIGQSSSTADLVFRRNTVVGNSKSFTMTGSQVLSSLYQDGGATQGAATPLDLSKQVHILADSWFSLADGEEGQICHFTMNNTASAEDILIEVDHLKISQSGAATTLVNAVWNPFPFGSGNFVATLATAVFTGNAWSVSQGTIV
jgi:hypothetical protein